MPFASTNPTNPRTNPWNFHKKILRIGGVGKSAFFKSAILNSIFFQKNFFFCLIPMKTRQSLLVSKDGSKFWWLPWFAAHEVLDQHLCTALYISQILLDFHNLFAYKWRDMTYFWSELSYSKPYLYLQIYTLELMFCNSCLFDICTMHQWCMLVRSLK